MSNYFHDHIQQRIADKRKRFGDPELDPAEKHNRVRRCAMLFEPYLRVAPYTIRKGKVVEARRQARLKIASTLIGRTITSFDFLSGVELSELTYATDFPESMKRMSQWAWEQIKREFERLDESRLKESA